MKMFSFSILTTILLFCELDGYGQINKYNDFILKSCLPDGTAKKIGEQGIEQKYMLSDFINPFYLEADFNGDNILDIAITVEEIETGKLGFIVMHGSSNQYHVIGAGTSCGNGGDNFRWMDIWNVERNKQLNEEHASTTAIYVGKSESAGGMIYWDSRNYVWDQAGD